MPADDRTREQVEMENQVLRTLMARGDAFNGLPRWVKIIGVVGFPAFIAIYFLARDAGYVPSVFTSTSSQMSAVQRSMEQQRERLEANTRVLTTGLKVLCLNEAGSDLKRINRCQEIQ